MEKKKLVLPLCVCTSTVFTGVLHLAFRRRSSVSLDSSELVPTLGAFSILQEKINEILEKRVSICSNIIHFGRK